jgi:hypothetical protein
LQFAVASGVNIGEGGAGGDEPLWVCNALGGAEDFQELIALPIDAPEQAGLLENKRPGDERGEEKNAEYAACDPAGLRNDIKNVANENGVQEKKNVCLLGREEFLRTNSP